LQVLFLEIQESPHALLLGPQYLQQFLGGATVAARFGGVTVKTGNECGIVGVN